MSDILTITVQGDGAEALIASIRRHADILGLRPMSDFLHAGYAGAHPDAPPTLIAVPAFPAGHTGVGHA